MDNEGNDCVKMGLGLFGKAIRLLRYYGRHIKRTYTKTFQVYLRTKINHIIPHSAITGALDQLWTTIRKIIFNEVLNRSTFQKESSGAFGRPVLRLM